MLFAHLKRIFRLGRLRLPAPSGAAFAFTLAPVTQNLRRQQKYPRRRTATGPAITAWVEGPGHPAGQGGML
jgi:hypothetical protein